MRTHLGNIKALPKDVTEILNPKLAGLRTEIKEET